MQASITYEAGPQDVLGFPVQRVEYQAGADGTLAITVRTMLGRRQTRTEAVQAAMSLRMCWQRHVQLRGSLDSFLVVEKSFFGRQALAA